ncbi:MAG: hypothetical protein JW736_01800 [Deltaproteobacteria bacterium]|nr:hypothetical protein [Deltaproteobacteria bacterium]
MKRRRFIKMALVTVSVMYGLPGRLFRLGGNQALASNGHDPGKPEFSGSYFTELIHDRILMPGHLLVPLKKTGFDVVALKGNGLLLIPASNPLIKLFNEVGSSRLFKEDFLVLRRDDIAVSDDVYVGIPGEMQTFAGIGPGRVSVIGRRNLIEIVNPGR